MSLEGKLILITGSARGIGRSMAEHFLKSGAAVVLSDILAEELDATVEALAAEYGADKVSGYPCNVSDEESVVGMFKAMGDDGKFIDTAILNAGILRDGLLVKTDRETGEVIREMSLAQWKLVIDVNLTGVFLTGREAAKLMIKGKKKGVIINMSSIARHGNLVRPTTPPPRPASPPWRWSGPKSCPASVSAPRPSPPASSPPPWCSRG